MAQEWRELRGNPGWDMCSVTNSTVMAEIEETATGRRQLLEAEYLIGRMPTCSLRLSGRFVSAHHAILRFSGERWELRDLGSRNGSYVDGVRVRAGAQVALRRGARIAFGRLDNEWQLLDDSAPAVMIVPLAGGPPQPLSGEMIALPSSEEPLLTIYRNADGIWVLETADAVSIVENLQTFHVNGQDFRFSCPEASCRTSIMGPPSEPEMQQVALHFSVSSDEEHVALQVTSAGRTVDLGSHSFHYLLLTLARRRLADAEAGLPETTSGWINLEDLEHDPSMLPPQLNIDVFRIRKQFETIGVSDPASIIERRPRTRQLRIGVSRISIVRV